MQTAVECIPCLVSHSLEAAQLLSDDVALHESILRDTLSYVALLSYDISPPEISRTVHRRIREVLKNPDPYREKKRFFNDLALSLLPGLEAEVKSADDPFERAVHFAIAGNVIDFGVTANLTAEDVHAVIEQVAEQPLIGDVEWLRRKAESAERILYLADNTGEIVLDRLLLKQLPCDRVTVVVRDAPIINDATMEDAAYAGITDFVRVISNGDAAPGTVLRFCSEEFLDEFNNADLIISKGQGNYESLEEYRQRPIAFLFRVKCAVAARLSGYPIGSHVVLPAAEFR